MNLSLPDVKEVLILAPHPDDEAIGCAGALLQLNKEGVASTIVFLTNGEGLYGDPSDDIAGKRKKEAQTSAEMLGCREALFLDLPDGELEKEGERLYQKLYRIIKEKKPEIVFVPSIIDYHPDHIAAAGIALELLKDLEFFQLAFYEIYSTIRFTHLVDITEVVERKNQIIMNYKSSLYDKPEVYMHASLGLNAQRSIFVQKKGYYEAFYITERADEIDRIYDYLCYKEALQ